MDGDTHLGCAHLASRFVWVATPIRFWLYVAAQEHLSKRLIETRAVSAGCIIGLNGSVWSSHGMAPSESEVHALVEAAKTPALVRGAAPRANLQLWRVIRMAECEVMQA
jgi:hypothetical protein